ncbi:hypothetical protein [Pedobacter sp.]|uniref:hypothetical protein n=1 Tax=Pedobacter sp. TaxID=1411316 RepID=UPI003BAA677A
MKKLLNLAFYALISLTFISAIPVVGKIPHLKYAKKKHSLDSLSDARVIKQLYINSTQALLSSKLATYKSKNSRLKVLTEEIVERQIALNEDLRALSKAKGIDLPMSTPEGGLRPDGRIDSAPENLRDTSRIQNAGGEAVVQSGKKPQANIIDEVSVSTEVNRLKNLDEKSIDKAYQQSATTNQNQLIALLEEAGNSTDSEIKVFSKKYLPQAKQQLKKLGNIKL